MRRIRGAWAVHGRRRTFPASPRPVSPWPAPRLASPLLVPPRGGRVPRAAAPYHCRHRRFPRTRHRRRRRRSAQTEGCAPTRPRDATLRRFRPATALASVAYTRPAPDPAPPLARSARSAATCAAYTPRVRRVHTQRKRTVHTRCIRSACAVHAECMCWVCPHCSSCTPPPFAAHGSGAGHKQQRLRLARGKHGGIQKAQPSNGAVLSLDLGRQATAGSRRYRRVSALYVHCACTVRALSPHCMCKGRRFDPLPRR